MFYLIRSINGGVAKFIFPFWKKIRRVNVFEWNATVVFEIKEVKINFWNNKASGVLGGDTTTNMSCDTIIGVESSLLRYAYLLLRNFSYGIVSCT